MAEHEPLDIADKDAERTQRPEARGARMEGTTPAGFDTRATGGDKSLRDDAAAASEPMELQRLPESMTPPPPGRQRTGDPPSPRASAPRTEDR